MNDKTKVKEQDVIVDTSKTATHMGREIEIKENLRSQDVNLPAAIPAEQSPMALMIQAKQAGFSMEEIKEMMDLQDRNDKRIAKKAFDKAMADFKRNPPKVIKDLINNQYNSSYSSIGNTVSTVNEAMGPFGLSARWEYPEPSDPATLVKVTCILSHELGHEISVTLEGPIDVEGKKNKMQGRKSGRTYLKLETYEAVTGIASEAGNIDDDGNSTAPPPVPPITEAQANKIYSMLDEHELDRSIFLGWVNKAMPGTQTVEDIPNTFFDRVIKKIEESIKMKEKNE